MRPSEHPDPSQAPPGSERPLKAPDKPPMSP